MLGAHRGIVHRVAVGALALNMAFHGLGKLLARAGEVAAFDRWGYSPEFRLAIGALELLAVVGLLIASTRPWACLGILGLMMGATATHVRFEEWTWLLLPAFTVTNAAVVWRTAPKN